jgi:Ni/Co efflux regulator RcnB
MKRYALITATLGLALAAPAFADKGRKHDHPPGHAPRAEARHDNGRHLGWHKQAWKRGDRIVLVDVEPRYYVDDYRVYRLDAPPRGYRWIRPMDDRYLLVEVATGLIVQALGY